MPRRLVLSAAAAVALAAIGPSIATPSPPGGHSELTLGTTVAGELEGARALRLTLALRPGQFVRLSLEQEREHARLRLFDPSGERIAETDGSLGFRLDRVELSFIAARAGDHRLEVKPLLPRAPALRYRLRIEELRPAERDDGARIAAERAFVEGVRLYREPEDANLESARELLRQALETWSDLRRPDAIAASRTQLGVVESHTRPSKGVSLCKQALQEWRRLELDSGGAVALDCVGDGNLRRWELEQARQSYEELLAFGTATRRLGIQARALAQLGWIAVFTGDPESAVATLERAVAIQRQRGHSRGMARASIRLAAALSRAGRHQEGLDVFRDASNLAQEIDAGHLVLLALGGTGRIYSALGDFERALASQQQRLELARGLNRRDQEANTLLTLGVVYSHFERYEEAREAYEQVLRIVEQRENRWAETVAHTNLGATLNQLGRHGEAIPNLRTAIDLARAIPDREAEARAVVELGSTRLALGQIEHARRLLTRGRTLSREIGVLDQEMRATYYLARLERGRGNLQVASRLAAGATVLAESLRARVGMDTLRVSLLAQTRALYELQIDLLVALHESEPQAGHAARAFATAERIKSRALFELMSVDPGAFEARLAPPVRQRKVAAERRLTRLQRDYVRVASDARSPEAERVRLRAELQATESELTDIYADMRRRDPELAEWLDPQPVDSEQAHGILPPGSALLSYVLGEHGSYLFVVADGALTAHRLPPAVDLEALVERTRSVLERPGARRLKRYVDGARELYDALIGPAQTRLDGIRRLFVSPDGALHYLPFEALLRDDTSTTDVARLPYLLQRWTVSYTPSASVLVALERRRSSAPRAPASAEARVPELAAFVAMAPSGEGPSKATLEVGGTSRAAMRGVLDEEEVWTLPPLPHAADEIERIVGRLGAERVRVFAGPEASEGRLKENQALASARWIHFATHSVISERRPLYSGLVLNLDDPTAGDDGFLQVYEILDLSLTADVVVLSACETALGQHVRGEGILGLSRAFLTAGAASLVVSLWQVADDSTAELMAGLYTRLAAEEDAATALRQAKLDLLADGRFAHPFYWAPFVVVGAAP